MRPLSLKFLGWCSILTFFILACNRKTFPESEQDYLFRYKDKSIDSTTLLNTLLENQAFLYLQAKGNLIIHHEGNQYETAVHAQVVHDSAALLTAKQFGLELGRVLLDTVSYQLLDRFSQTYSTGPVRDLPGYAGDWVNFQSIQNILFYGYHLPVSITYAIDFQEDIVLIRGNSKNQHLELRIGRNSLLPISFSATYANQSLRTDMKNYQKIGTHYYPTEVNIQAVDLMNQQTSGLRVEWKNFDVKPIASLNFKIPPHYDRIR